MADQQVGSAYIEVKAKLDPKAGDEVKRDLEKTKVEDSGKKLGEEVGDGLGKGIDAKAVAIGNIVANVVTAAAQKAAQLIGDVIGGAFENYANYEQLVGGVEKLFGADSQAVLENANQAFRTAGLSANEYMEQVTSFSASMISSLDGDTAAAVRYADQALQDMADNANVFGSDIASIQNAYQGFAKGNFTMLDNLKLGFGGTRAEAERLAAEAEAITGIHYDVDNLAEFTEAIHVMQVEYGIAATTSKEAASTIQGSMSMLKASWANWLTAIAGGGDIDAATEALISSLETMAQNALPRLATIVGNLIKELPRLIASALSTLPSMAGELVKALFGEGAGAAFEGVLAQLSPTVEALAAAFGDMAERLAPVVEQMMPALMSVGSAVGGLLLQIAQTLGGMIATALPYITSFLEWILPFVTPIVQFIASAITRITGLFGQQSGALKSLQGIVKAVGNVFKTVANTIINGWREIPGKIIGFFTGIGARIGQAFGQIHVPLPHFSISPAGWQIGDLLKGSIPSLSIQWYAQGGIVDGAALIGAGEAGREAIVPLENRSAMQPFAAAVSENMGDSGTFADILAVLLQIRDRTQAVYLDGDAVGRVMAPQMNRRIGNSAVMASRGGASYAF